MFSLRQVQPSPCITRDRAYAFTAIDFSFSGELSLILTSEILCVTDSPLICLTVPFPIGG